MTFAERLRTLRTERGMTQQALADRLDVRQSTIGMLEAGLSRPSYALLLDLSSCLGLSASVLMEGVTE